MTALGSFESAAAEFRRALVLADGSGIPPQGLRLALAAVVSERVVQRVQERFTEAHDDAKPLDDWRQLLEHEARGLIDLDAALPSHRAYARRTAARAAALAIALIEVLNRAEEREATST